VTLHDLREARDEQRLCGVGNLDIVWSARGFASLYRCVERVEIENQQRRLKALGERSRLGCA
jgi:hypothetical protein